MPSDLPDPQNWINALGDVVDTADQERLARNPLGAIPELFDVKVKLDADADSSTCPLHGSYFVNASAITVASTASRGRVRFSALHELGHYLIRELDLRSDLLDYERHRELEEAICDGFAAAILLPDELVDRYIADTGPTAADVAALWAASHASRSATCVAAASRLPSPGYVMLTDLDARALFTAAHRTKYRVAADVVQGEDSLPSRAARFNGRSRGTASIRFASGSQSGVHEGDAVVDGEYVFAVFVLTRAPWVTMDWVKPDMRRRAPRPCPRCGESFVWWDNLYCDGCHEARCPHCERCGCPQPSRPTEICSVCFATKAAHLFQQGVCRDCQ